MICPVAHWANLEPKRQAVVWEGGQWTYGELERQVQAWTAFFKQSGVTSGDRVGSWSWNHPRLVPQLFALGRLGAAMAPFNARLTAAEVQSLREKLQPRMLLAEFELGSALGGQWVCAESAEGGLRPDPAPRGEPALELDSIAAALFTSGTTGVPKAALLSWRNFAESAKANEQNLGSTYDQRWLAILPLFHVGGLAMVTRCAVGGGCLILHRRFDAPKVNAAIDADGVTHASFVSNTLSRVLEARGAAPFPRTFRFALVGGGPVSEEIHRLAQEKGAGVLQTYGLTEACSQVATERSQEADGRTAGPPLPGISIRIVDERARTLSPGEAGEIEVQGPTVMRGYLNEENATRAALRQGWLRTGDLGALDSQGRLRVLSRRTDLIISGGENIYPAEVEATLQACPGVRDAAVLAKADSVWGQVPVALVALNQALSEGELHTWCRARLASYKAPRQYLFVSEIPRNASGKIDRGQARLLWDTGGECAMPHAGRVKDGG